MNQRILFYTITGLAVLIAAQYGLCIQDDTFISFRYAENFVHGDGLVFNPGERVEGITNLLWTLTFAILMAVGIDPVVGAYVLGLFSIGFLMWSTLRLSSELNLKWHWLAVLVIGIDASILLEAVEGLESVAFAGVTTLAVATTISSERRRKEMWLPGVLCAIALLLRPEGLGVTGLIALGVLLNPDNRRAKLVSLLGLVIPVTFCLLSLSAFRLLYYGDILPNTFYAKVGGLQWSRGLTYWAHHALQHPLIWASMFVGIFVCYKEYRLRLPVVFALGYTVYVIAVGGDFKPTARFFIPVVPVAAVLLADFAYRRVRPWPILGITLAVVLLFFRWDLFKDSMDWAQTRRMNLLGRKAAGEWIARYTPPDTVIAMHSVGVVPFYSKRVCIDMWGLNDRVIARTPIKHDPDVLIGHQRSNPSYVFSKKPDLYIPEDDWLVLDDIQQEVEPGFPDDFLLNYTAVSIPLGASYMNIWVRNSFARDTLGMNIGDTP